MTTFFGEHFKNKYAFAKELPLCKWSENMCACVFDSGGGP